MNKRILAFLILFLTGAIAMAQKPVDISGKIDKSARKQVKLFKVADGSLTEVSTFNLKEDSTFRFSFFPEYEGFYVLGLGSPTSPQRNYTFYFKAGDKLDVNMTDSAYVLQGKLNSTENQIMSKWFDLAYKVKQKSIGSTSSSINSTFVDFFPDLEALNKDSKEFIAKHKSGNPKFEKAFPMLVKWDVACYGLSFLFSGRNARPTPEQYSPTIKSINGANFTKNTKELTLYPYGRRNMMLLVQLESMKNKIAISNSIVGLENVMKYIVNDTLKGDQLLVHLSHQKDYRNFSEAREKFGRYIITSAQKKTLATYESKLDPFKPGDLAFDFAFPDVNDKIVKMSDLKGKMVVIDIWATWCGPCVQEIPHFKKLEEAFKDKNVTFVSISFDHPKDKDKWLQMIKKDQMEGVQLLGTSLGEFARHYKINTIPRFMVFDKQGRLVTADSPRPSDPKLKMIIEEELNKG